MLGAPFEHTVYKPRGCLADPKDSLAAKFVVIELERIIRARSE